MTAGPAPGWYRDPSGRFEYRYWEGQDWSEHVATGGVASTDPTRAGPPAAGRPPLASPGQRLASFALDLALLIVTLFVGWLVWACITFGQAQSPAKAILGQRVVKEDTGQAASRGDMFLRNVVVQLGLTLLSLVTFGIPLLLGGGLVVAGDRRQAAWDLLAGTLVVVDRHGVTLLGGGPVRY